MKMKKENFEERRRKEDEGRYHIKERMVCINRSLMQKQKYERASFVCRRLQTLFQKNYKGVFMK